MLYLPTQNLYIGSRGIYTEEQVEWADKEEQAWKESLPRYTVLQLIELFPQGRAIVRRKLAADIKQFKADLNEAFEIKHKIDRIIARMAYKNQEFYRDVAYCFYVTPLQAGKEEAIKRYKYFYRLLKPKPKPKKIVNSDGKEELAPIEPYQQDMNRITEHDIATAREMPLEYIYPFKLRKQGARGTGLCPFHDEKTGSFFIYLKQNKWHCFGGCGGGDVIDFVRKRDGCDFLTAVKKLLNK